ncbi:myb/SANT-like DNA-binding domain-containing protein 2 isoform X1 [Athene cunicularia]|uniref:myb/SANT-like DNA-binding domain-containing protein 2 isoform X1 n=1 Tax=Athene cunicularia TaxID=194338 RepID=UPI000EF6BE46|nr:myb/SANT-like DNA-binding domain-containing protein 2 isoform X1 [Athene cunicularia]
MYERVSRALAELGYERTPSQCRERIKLHKRQSELVRNAKYTLRRCYSRVKEHGVGKRKSSYTFEQLEQVFGQGGWDSQPCQPVLINSSGLYQELESDGSTMEEYSQEDWGNHSQDLHCYQTGEQELDEMPTTKRTLKIKQESSEDTQKRDVMQNIMQILESVQLKWELFQSWTDFSRLHLSNKLAIFGIGYNTRWKEDIRYHYAEISSQVPLGKRLREYFNSEKPEGRVIMTRVQKMNWKNVYYKFLEITISEARCLELHMEIDWIPIAHSKPTGGNVVQYLLPGGIPKSPGLYAIGYEECHEKPPSPLAEHRGPDPGNETQGELEVPSPQASLRVDMESTRIIYCYLGIAEVRTLQQCLFLHFQANTKTFSKDWVGINAFLSQNCVVEPGVSPKSIYIKFVEVERDFLSAGSLVECLEKAIGYPLKFNN